MQPPDFKNPYNVILIGEFHERDKDQVSETLRSFLDKIHFECSFTLYREQVTVTKVVLDLKKGPPPPPHILPLEEGTLVIDKVNDHVKQSKYISECMVIYKLCREHYNLSPVK